MLFLLAQDFSATYPVLVTTGKFGQAVLSHICVGPSKYKNARFDSGISSAVERG
jgi:hypothetical protein